jgi:CarD family transcriptional regulator
VAFMFLIGEIVYYPVFGAGVIVNIEEKEICDEIKKYYIIKLIISDMNIMVPLDSNEAKKIRKAISNEECSKVMEILKENPMPIPGKWSERYKYYSQSMRQGDIFTLSSILRDIAGFSRKKDLSKSEINVFKDILYMVCGEMCLVLKEDYRACIVTVLNILKMSNISC